MSDRIATLWYESQHAQRLFTGAAADLIIVELLWLDRIIITCSFMHMFA